MAAMTGYEEPLTVEEQWARGAMNPEEFVKHAEQTGGYVAGVAHGPRGA